MKAVKRAAIVTVLLVSLAPFGLAKKALMTLTRLVEQSHLIVVAKVVKVHEAGSVRIAEATVAQTYKGDASLKRVFFLASPTWTCDTSGAVEGEAALLFLSNDSNWFSSRLIAEQNRATKTKLSQIVGAQPFFSIEASGSGRLPFTSPTSDYERGQLSVGGVMFPDSIKVTRRKRPNSYEWDYDQLVTFSETRDFIGQTLLKLHNKKTTSTKISKATL